ncbi:energy transducer TonB [Arcobacter defluvii]|uniref:Energy transduction protein TonB n=1 Tax=Arcobacter defluvii TaxID=873191 RepID=A0AAE7E6U6_9BACT|nr:energy transducer TonB [Arcobacter defluvii]QKF76894.1 energy transduction protein TonB [Arcobacter defluvii]RXI33769.1 TonB-dependent receptor [Arcobacter defluvii]
MENKKSLLVILTLTISAHLLLFANLKVTEEVELPAEPPAQVTKINLQNVVLKKPEPVVEPVIEKPVEIKPLPKTESKNKIKQVKKKEHHKKEKKVEKKVEKKIEEIKEVKQEIKEVIPLESSSDIKSVKKDIDPSLKDALENEYLAKIRMLIEKNKIYPKSAKRLNQMGKVHVCFVVSKDGQIKNIRIVKKSSFEKLDEAAIEILTKISNFEPIPEKLNKNSWEITVPIVYQITRS